MTRCSAHERDARAHILSMKKPQHVSHAEAFSTAQASSGPVPAPVDRTSGSHSAC
jgi:hypothetical protein